MPGGSTLGAATRITLTTAIIATVIMLLCYFLPIITIEWEEDQDCWTEWECTQTCTCGTEYQNCYEYHDRERCDVSCDDGCYSDDWGGNNCEDVEYCDGNSETHEHTFPPIHALGWLMVFIPVAGFGMALGIGTKFYMFVANPMPTCCASKQGWKCGAIQQIVGVILYFLAFIMIAAGHGQVTVAIDECDDCSQQDKDNMQSIFDAIFGALYPLLIVPLLFAILNAGLLCKAKDAWPDEGSVAVQAPAVAQVPVGMVAQPVPMVAQVPVVAK